MFGYVTINELELKIKDYRIYRGFYCGICHDLRKRYGLSGNLMLNYDLTFVALLLTALYEEKSSFHPYRCLLHPTKKGLRTINRYTQYAADMTILLSYYQCLDHWQDERRLSFKAEAMLLQRHLKRIGKQYPRQKKAVEDYVKELTEAEAANSENLDLVSGATGKMLGEIFVFQEDEWADTLRKTGFYLGKFIYLMDAYEDLERDREKAAITRC